MQSESQCPQQENYRRRARRRKDIPKRRGKTTSKGRTESHTYKPSGQGETDRQLVTAAQAKGLPHQYRLTNRGEYPQAKTERILFSQKAKHSPSYPNSRAQRVNLSSTEQVGKNRSADKSWEIRQRIGNWNKKDEFPTIQVGVDVFSFHDGIASGESGIQNNKL